MATTRAVVRVKRLRAVVRGSIVQVGGGGGGGGISGIVVKEAGDTVASDVTALNLTGSATVTDDGGGQVTIDVTGGGGNGSTGAVHVVPLASAFPTTVGSAVTKTDTTAALIVSADGHAASFDVQLVLQSAPASPWVRYFRFEMNPVQKPYLYGGFAIRRSSGAFVLWSLIQTGTVVELQYSEYASPTSRATFTTGISVDTTAVYWRIEDDGTDFVLSASPSGEAGTYVVAHSVSKTAYLADYDQIGFAADAYNNSAPNRPCVLSIQHYSASAPTYAAGSANGIGGTTDHASLTSIGWTQSGHTGTASTVAAFDSSGAAVTRSAGTTGLALLDDATQTDARTTLGLVPGTDVQAYDAGLASLAGVDTAADLLPYTTAAATWAGTTLTSYVRGLLDDVDAAAARGTLAAISGLSWVTLWDSATDGSSPYTYTSGSDDVLVRVRMCGGGGGGGGGRLDTGATAGAGGGGGSGGGLVEVYAIPADATGWIATPGAAGTAGTARTTTTGNGGAGGDGGASTWGPFRAPGGKGGAAGSNANTATPGTSAYNVTTASRTLVNHPAQTAEGGLGGPATASSTQPAYGKGGSTTTLGGSGGGAGGGMAAGNTAGGGANGGDVGSTAGPTGGAGTTSGSGTAGTAGASVAGSVVGTGGSGGGNSGAAGVGGAGGAGGLGSGGGGGGASHGTASGAGGAGGDGRVIVQVLRRTA